MTRFSRRFRLLALAVLLAAAVVCGQEKPKVAKPGTAARGRVLVTVNGVTLTQGDLDRMLLSRRIPEEFREKASGPMLEQMIDSLLVRRFLADRKITADARQLDDQVGRILRALEQEGDAAQKLAEMGYTEQDLRAELALPMAWEAYVRRTVTEKQIEAYFAKHQAELDGTRVRARHILLKCPTREPNPDQDAARERLTDLRAQIVAGEITFEKAAEQHSEAPSKEQGGDVGFFAWEGKMPVAFSAVAFGLKPGEISQPFPTPFGLHLCEVLEREPGEGSLEDARPDILRRLSQEMWNTTVKQLRDKATIER